MAESLWNQNNIPNMANNQQSILCRRTTSDETGQSESNGKSRDRCPTMQLLINFAAQQTFAPEFRYLPTELRLQIWEDRVTTAQPQIISLTVITAIDPTESATNIGSNTPQTACDARFSVRSALDFHLAHICFEAREVYLKTYTPLLGERKGYPIIYVNLQKDAIHFGPHFQIWHLQAFARYIDATQIHQLILEYDGGVALSLGLTLHNILEICLLFPNLKKLNFVPRAGLGLSEKCLDRLIKTND